MAGKYFIIMLHVSYVEEGEQEFPGPSFKRALIPPQIAPPLNMVTLSFRIRILAFERGWGGARIFLHVGYKKSATQDSHPIMLTP